jgi:hypothetical protein
MKKFFTFAVVVSILLGWGAFAQSAPLRAAGGGERAVFQAAVARAKLTGIPITCDKELQANTLLSVEAANEYVSVLLGELGLDVIGQGFIMGQEEVPEYGVYAAVFFDGVNTRFAFGVLFVTKSGKVHFVLGRCDIDPDPSEAP